MIKKKSHKHFFVIYFLLFYSYLPCANALIININAEKNTTTSPVVEYFNSGVYTVMPIGKNDGGNYNAWNTWNWGEVNLPNVGWMNTYWFQIDQQEIVSISDGKKYGTDTEALSNAVSTSFTITSTSEPVKVKFFIVDGPNMYWDNVGGMSLKIDDLSNHKPNKPSSGSPLNKLNNVPINTIVEWEGGDPDPEDTITYTINLSSDPRPLYIDISTSNSYSPAILDYATTYFWQIVAEDNHGAITEGPIWQFTTIQNNPPDKPTNINTNNEQIFPPGQIALELNEFSDTENDNHFKTYWKVRKAGFYYQCKGAYSDYCYTATTGNPTELTQYTFTNLEPGMKYFWMAAFEDDYSTGNITWSDEYSFIIGNSTIESPGKISASIEKNQFMMVSFTQWPNNSNATNLFGNKIGSNYENDFRIGTYDTLNSSYIEYNNNLTIKPGISYWFLARTGLDVQIEGVSVSLNYDIDIPINYNSTNNDGWNMIGCPNKANYQWGNIEVIQYNDDSTIISGPFSISDSTNQNIIETLIDRNIWYWQNGNYIEETNPDFVLEFYKGYWVKSKAENVYLRFSKNHHVKRSHSKSLLTKQLYQHPIFVKGKNLIKLNKAYASANEPPPPPMRSFGEKPITVDSSGACFMSIISNSMIKNAYVNIATFIDHLLNSLAISITLLIISVYFLLTHFQWFRNNFFMKKTFILLLFVSIFLLTPSLTKEIKAEDNNGQNYYDEGRFYLKKKDFAKAKEYLKSAVKISPTNPFYNYYLGKLHLESKNLKLASTYLEKAWEKNKNIHGYGLKYDIALLRFYEKKYSKASKIFLEIIQNTQFDVRHILSSYYAGICLFKEKEYKKAARYLQDATDLNQKLKISSYYYIGICNLKLGFIKESIDRFEYVKKNAKNYGLINLERYASKWLYLVEQKQKILKPYRLLCKLIYQYDDNIFLDPEDEDIYSDKNDFSTVGFFSFDYKMSIKESNQVNLGYSHYQSWYSDHSKFNMTGSILDFNTSIKYRNFYFTFIYMPSFFWIDNESYLNRHSFIPQMKWRLSDNLLTIFSISHCLNNNSIDDKRDGNTSDIFAAIYSNLPEYDILLFGKLGYESNSAEHNDYEYDNVKIESGASMPVFDNINLKYSIMYINKSFKHSDITYRTKRKDNKFEILFNVSYQYYNDWVRFNSIFQHIENNSNINKFEYNKNTFSFSIAVDF